MADGIRIRPSTERLRAAGVTSAADRLVMVRDVSRTYPDGPRFCGYCTRAEREAAGWKGQDVLHEHKTYHFQLEGDGTVMVSTAIWDRLQRMLDNGGFERVNVVATPPSQSISLPTATIITAAPLI